MCFQAKSPSEKSRDQGEKKCWKRETKREKRKEKVLYVENPRSRFRTTSECVPEGPLTPLVKSPASSKGKIPRFRSGSQKIIILRIEQVLIFQYSNFNKMSGKICTDPSYSLFGTNCSPGTSLLPTLPRTKETSAQPSPPSQGELWTKWECVQSFYGCPLYS